MTIEGIILLILASIYIPKLGYSNKFSNIILFFLSSYLGCDHTVSIYWLDCDMYVCADSSFEVTVSSNDGSITCTQHALHPEIPSASSTVRDVNMRVEIQKMAFHVGSGGNVRLFVDFIDLRPNDVCVYLDGYRMVWDANTSSFILDTTDGISPQVWRTREELKNSSWCDLDFSIAIYTKSTALERLGYL